MVWDSTTGKWSGAKWAISCTTEINPLNDVARDIYDAIVRSYSINNELYVNGAKPEGLNILQQSAADANAAITGVVGAVQDTISSEAKGDLFGNIQNVVTGKMTAEEAVASAIALN